MPELQKSEEQLKEEVSAITVQVDQLQGDLVEAQQSQDAAEAELENKLGEMISNTDQAREDLEQAQRSQDEAEAELERFQNA